MKRKVIQIAVAECQAFSRERANFPIEDPERWNWMRTIIALCDDGTIWQNDGLENSTWERLPDIPEDDRQSPPPLPVPT